MACKRRTDLTFLQKKEICDYKDAYAKATQDSIAEHFTRKWGTPIARRTVGNILQRKADWTTVEVHQLKAKRSRKPKFAVLEEALAMWFATMQAKKAIISDAILIAKGKEFAERLHCTEFSPSGGWLSRFKSRHGISLRTLHGEAASVDVSVVAAARSTLKDVLSKYEPADIYNVDETGLFYRMPPSKSLAQGPLHGTKQFKDRITIALCANADGSDYIKPLVIGKSANPRCFKDFNKDTYVQYANNKKAWMTGYLFSEWLHHFDRHIKQKKNRPVLLLMDNVASHFPDVSLECVTVHHLPPNTTSHLQPLDAGIIRSFKAYYRGHQVKRLIELLEEDKKADINLKEAIRYLALAWKSVSCATIKNCWKHTGIMPVTEGIQDVNEDPLQELTSLLNAPILSRAECLSASTYLDEDENLETGDLPTDDDILAMVEGGCENDDDDDNDDNGPEEDRTPPTSQQAMEAAKVLQYYFDSKNDEEGSWAVVGIQKMLEKAAAQSKVQTSLLNYFKH